MKSNTYIISTVAGCAIFSSILIAQEPIALDPIVVNSDFRAKELSQTSNSVTVIGEDKLYDKSSQPLIETLASVPNVNFSAGASKAKYIQIRGIGERSQFETPINPSVGLIIDGIDFSSSTLGAGAFDIHQIEVLRGPQGTTFGANALAGVVTIKSNEPTKELEGHLEATVGNYGTHALGVAVGGSLIEDTLIGRFSIYKNSSDGFMENSHLDKKDTNNIDELATKAQLRWFASDNLTMDLNYIHVDVDNGYDAFTFDNSRVSLADEPGEDTQKTDALSVKSTYDTESQKIISKMSYSKSDMTYSYDEDWANPDYHADAWSGSDEYKRDKEEISIDIRVLSQQNARIFNGTTDWTFGIYYKNYSDKLTRDHTWSAIYKGEYKTENKAVYGQFDTHLSDKLSVISGLRVEKIEASFSDSNDFDMDTDETLMGGKLGLNYKVSADTLYYLSLSKGYKPGGVNANDNIPKNAKEFETETLWNVDLGINSTHLNNKLKSRVNFFYGKREDQQVKSSFVTNPTGGEAKFNEYFANAAKGSYYGAEIQLNYALSDDLNIFANVGLLESEFDEYTDPNPEALDVNGRAPAQSPKYQYNLGANYMLGNAWIIKADIEGKSSYYFSNRHNYKSEAYTLLNSSIEYTISSWSAILWAKNITDEDTQVRGFGTFGNNAANGWQTELYTQQGSPRTFGATISYDF